MGLKELKDEIKTTLLTADMQQHIKLANVYFFLISCILRYSEGIFMWAWDKYIEPEATTLKLIQLCSQVFLKDFYKAIKIVFDSLSYCCMCLVVYRFRKNILTILLITNSVVYLVHHCQKCNLTFNEWKR